MKNRKESIFELQELQIDSIRKQALILILRM